MKENIVNVAQDFPKNQTILTCKASISSSLSILTTTLGCADISHLHIDIEKLEKELWIYIIRRWPTRSINDITYLMPLELGKEPFCIDPMLHDYKMKER